jgi:hypothetical protein
MECGDWRGPTRHPRQKTQDKKNWQTKVGSVLHRFDSMEAEE